MNKRGVGLDFIVLLFAFLVLIALSAPNARAVENDFNSEIKKLTHYAEEYETGNIDYVQFLLHTFKVREEINVLLGATNRQNGGTLTKEQLESALGNPNEYTRWVWVEKEEREKRLDEEMPVWRKIVFDGSKIQVRINAFPNLFTGRKFNDKTGKDEFEGGETLVYRLNFESEFKEQQPKIDFESKIDEIKSLAEEFSKNPSQGNGEDLARESVAVEKSFENYFRTRGDKCEDILNEIFGGENKNAAEKIVVWEIPYVQGEDYDALLRMEFCDECEWSWININGWIETRGNGARGMNDGPEDFDWGEYKNLEWEDYEAKTKDLLEKYSAYALSQSWKDANGVLAKLNALSEGWNQKSNEVWKEVEKLFPQGGEGENVEQKERYWWLKVEQQKRQKVNELLKADYNKRKNFYESLFSDYDKKEFYFEQIQWDKRLIEQFRESGQEICDNGVDDNKNQQIDCSESQCAGKICGQSKVSVEEGNGTVEREIELYCIAGACQAKEVIIEDNASVCGNHICESGETCAEDCSLCPTYNATECNGRLMFRGSNENGCPLDPICLEENSSCVSDSDCSDTLCGDSQCIEGQCTIVELVECRESECTEGQQRVLNCASGERLVSGTCTEGVWKEIETLCSEDRGGVIPGMDVENETEITKIEEREGSESMVEEGEIVEESVGNACTVKSDCGNENDVCSNGICVTIPLMVDQPSEETDDHEYSTEGGEDNVEEQKGEEGDAEGIQEEEVEEPEAESTEASEANENPADEPAEVESSESSGVTGNFVFDLVVGLAKITGFDVEAGDSGDSGGDESDGASGGAEGGSSDSSSEDSEEDSGSEGESSLESEEGLSEGPLEESSAEDSDGGQNQNDPGQVDGDDVNREERERDEDEQRDEERRERQREDDERRAGECEDNCARNCYDQNVRPCVEKCAKEACGEKWECNIDEETKQCEGICKEEVKLDECESSCGDKCLKGEKYWSEGEDKKNDFKENMGGFQAGGSCRTSQGKTEGFIWFGGWGEPFEDLQRIKNQYYSQGSSDWCKREFENLKKQREEFVKGFDEEFVRWFFEEYLSNSANDWEKHLSGIYDLYWKDVEMSKQMVEKMSCLGMDELPQMELINVKYETEYGSLEFWEEIIEVDIGGKGTVKIISPYMKTWIFPPEQFITYEMKKSMKEHRMPGPDGEESTGPSKEEMDEMRGDSKMMSNIQKLSEKYGGSFDVVLQFKDYEKEEIIFNVYVKIDQEDLIQITPMLPEDNPAEDVKVVFDYDKLYNLIHTSEKEMRGAELESPPWDRKPRLMSMVSKVSTFMALGNQVRALKSSAEYSPKSAEKDAKRFVDDFFMGMMGGMNNEEPENKGDEEGKEVWESKQSITGEVIL